MSCYRPIVAFQPLDGGPLLFVERKDTREIQIKCGQCIGCRIEKQENWAIRCMLESKMHLKNSFVTLTYDQDHLPQNGSLNYRDFQLFAKRLRQKVGAFRFFVAGEYGEELSRPHFHALLFGLDFDDKLKCNSVYSSHNIYRSPVLEKLWPHGFSTIGSVTYQSCRYTATYCVKKINGDLADTHYSRVIPETGEIVQLVPEFARMSLRPGIGATWLEKYWKDIYATGHDAVIVNGSRKRVPRYFDNLLDDGAFAPRCLRDEVEYDRYVKSLNYSEDRTPDRLAVREQCAIARAAFEKGKYNQGVLRDAL